ncbi:MAG TPA: hypothetical protein VFE62_13225 [Gemmataceae bacterium]|nr:hypothetical protein [Gemmataceae bacterium]
MPFNIKCTHCDKALRIPDHAAGKRIRCPNCKEIVAVPEQPAEDATTGVTAAGPGAVTPSVTPSATPTEPKKKAAWDDEEETPPASTAESKPKAAWDDDGEREEAEKPGKSKSKKSRGKYDDRDDEDDDDDLPRRRRRYDAPPQDNMSNAAMILGIAAITLAGFGLLCCPVGMEPLAAIIALHAIIIGFLAPRTGQAKAGIICGFIALAIVVVVVLLFVLVLGFQINQMNQMNRRGF